MLLQGRGVVDENERLVVEVGREGENRRSRGGSAGGADVVGDPLGEGGEDGEERGTERGGGGRGSREGVEGSAHRGGEVIVEPSLSGSRTRLLRKCVKNDKINRKGGMKEVLESSISKGGVGQRDLTTESPRDVMRNMSQYGGNIPAGYHGY